MEGDVMGAGGQYSDHGLDNYNSVKLLFKIA